MLTNITSQVTKASLSSPLDFLSLNVINVVIPSSARQLNTIPDEKEITTGTGTENNGHHQVDPALSYNNMEEKKDQKVDKNQLPPFFPYPYRPYPFPFPFPRFPLPPYAPQFPWPIPSFPFPPVTVDHPAAFNLPAPPPV
ncbi:hypothetical protein CR513_09386, partial [Mucuna pruriens]